MTTDISLGLRLDQEILARLDETRLGMKPKMSRKAAMQEAVQLWVRKQKKKVSDAKRLNREP